MTALDRMVDTLRNHGSTIRSSGGRTTAQCPAHEDRNPSLSVTGIEGSVLLHCHAGCHTDDVLDALKLAKADLYDEPRGATYTYDDGRTVHRTPSKGFRQSGNTKGTALYHLAQLIAAVKAGRTVHLVEGEKDVHAVEALGGVATTAPGGSNVHKADLTPLHGAHVIAVVDQDDAGAKWATKVRDTLDAHTASLTFVHAATGKDAADHIAAGHSLNELVPIEAAAPAGEALARLVPGGTFILDQPDRVPALWGDGTGVVWAEGEALTLCGPAGVGKTTLSGQVVHARIIGCDVLGMPVQPTTSRILYLAMDRPRQIARALRRTLAGVPRATLDDRLVFWPGPPMADLAKHPDELLGLAQLAGADTVVIDSIKDAAIGLSDDEVGAGYNRARQTCLANGVEVLELHHMVKRGVGGNRPTTLADVYGSTWLTAGSGSVVLLWGEAGDPIVDWTHLKPPADEIGPFKVLHDHDAGRSTVWHSADLLMLAKAAGTRGITAKAAAASLFSTETPTPAQREKARRRLDQLVKADKLARHEGSEAGQQAAVWTLTDTLTHPFGTVTPHDPHAPSRSEVNPQVNTLTETLTTLTPGDPHERHPPFTGGRESQGNTEPAECDTCSAPLLLRVPGRTTCEACQDQRKEPA